MGRTRLRGFEWAGCRIAVETGSGWDWHWPAGWGDRVCSPVDADVQVSVAVTDAGGLIPDAHSDFHSFIHEGSLFEAGRVGGDPLFACGDGRLARFDRGFQFGAVTVPASAARAGLFPLSHPLDDLVVIHRALAAGALAVRATAVVRDGKALVLLGDAAIDDPSPRSAAWAGWLMLEPERDGVRVSPLPSTSVSGASSPVSVRLSGLHLVESMPSGSPTAATLDAEAGAAELLRFAFAPRVSAIPTDRVLETASQLAERVTIIRLAASGDRRFGWQPARSPLPMAPPAGA